MRVVFILAIFLSVSNAESISSFLTDGENKTSTSLESKKLECYDLGILRQMINQETVIRLALVKNVHALINDFNLIKQSLASSEATVTKLQRTNEALNLAVNSLQQENRKLQNNSRISESKIMELETKLQTVNDNLNIIQEDSDKKRQEIFNKTNSDLYDIKIVLRYLSVTLLDFKESTENENDLRDKKYEELKRLFNTSFENLKANYSQNEFYSTNNKALIQNLADSQAEIRRTCTEILNKTVAKHETQLKTSEYEQLKLSSAVALLEAAHRNLSKSNCVCLKEMNQQLEQELHKKIKEYFYKGFNSRLIHYLIQRNNNYDISYSCLVRKLLPRLGLKRRLAEIDLDDVFEKSQIEIQNGCAGSENLRRTLKMKYHFNVTRSISREIVKILDEDGVRRRKHRRLRRRQYFSRGPNFVWHLDGYDKLKPFGISIHGCIDGFSRRVIWLEADITNKRPEVVAEYYLSAVQMLKGCPQKIRADPGTENGIIATFHSCLKGNCSSVTLGTSTANQRIERFWGLLRQMRADFWIHHFKDLVYEDLLVLGNPIHRLSIQYVYLPLIKKDLKEIMEQWNNHLIRRQKLGDTIQGIPDVLFKNPEIVGASQYIYTVPHNTVARLQRLVSNNFKQIDEDFAHVATLILHQHGLPLPDALRDWTSARQLYIFLQENITHLMNL